jgi:hypothetical protein
MNQAQRISVVALTLGVAVKRIRWLRQLKKVLTPQ